MKLRLYEIRYYPRDSEESRTGLIASNLSRDNTLAKFVNANIGLTYVVLVGVGHIILDLEKASDEWGTFKDERIELYLDRKRHSQ